MTDGIARFKDFTGDQQSIQFAIKGEVFTAREDIPLAHLGKLAELGEGIGANGSDPVANILAVFEKLLEPESFERFTAAVEGRSPTVVGVSRVRAIIPWLLEQYGLRPTVAPSGSSTTSNDGGENSTDGALPADATS